MKVTRKINIETNDIQIGDCIAVGHYTATCQKIIGNDIALFLLDQYLDEPMQMNKMNTNKGVYQESDLRKELNSDTILKEFSGLELVPFDNGDLLRLPFYGEMIGHDKWYNFGIIEPDNCEQWTLMKERANRIAERKGETYEWGWLQNKYIQPMTLFCHVNPYGNIGPRGACSSIGARPVFQVRIEKEEI